MNTANETDTAAAPFEDELRDVAPLLTVAEAAKLLRVARSTVAAWIAAERLGSIVTGHGGSARRLIPRSAVRAFLEDGRRRAAREAPA